MKRVCALEGCEETWEIEKSEQKERKIYCCRRHAGRAAERKKEAKRRAKRLETRYPNGPLWEISQGRLDLTRSSDETIKGRMFGSCDEPGCNKTWIVRLDGRQGAFCRRKCNRHQLRPRKRPREAEYDPDGTVKCAKEGCEARWKPRQYEGARKWCDEHRPGPGRRGSALRRMYLKDRCEESSCTREIRHECELELDHIDGDHTNNEPSNLQTLCACCHKLKHHAPGVLEAAGRLAP